MEVVYNKKEKHIVRGASLASLKKNEQVQVVGPESNGKRKLLGSAKVRAQGKNGTRLELDEAADAARETLYVVIPDGAEPAPVASAPESEGLPTVSPPPVPKRLALGVKRTSLKFFGSLGVERGYIIHNSEKTALSSCMATLSKGFRHPLKSLLKGENKVGQGVFKHHADAPEGQEGWMLIECTEGRAEAEIQY
jgi:hypothetical protein